MLERLQAVPLEQRLHFRIGRARREIVVQRLADRLGERQQLEIVDRHSAVLERADPRERLAGRLRHVGHVMSPVEIWLYDRRRRASGRAASLELRHPQRGVRRRSV